MAQLSNELFQLLNGEKLAGKRREAMMLQTVTEEGWPHTAMISAGEILALNKPTSTWLSGKAQRQPRTSREQAGRSSSLAGKAKHIMCGCL